MSGSHPGPSHAPHAGPPRTPKVPSTQRTRLVLLLSFLGAFLLLIVLFRAVLFPFLMAIFLAYLIEPVVGWVSRRKRLGVQWGRGYVILLMYGIVLTGLVFSAACAVQKLDTTVMSAVASLKTELAKTSEKARFVVIEDYGGTVEDAKPTPSTITIPRGTAVIYDPPAGDKADARVGRAAENPAPGMYRTRYVVRIEAGGTDAEVLLEPDGPPRSLGADETSRLVDPDSVPLPKGYLLAIQPLPFAKGLEVFFERHVVEPIAATIEKATGDPFDPSLLRRGIAAESEKQGAKVGERLVEWGSGLFGTVFVSFYQVILVLMLTAFMVVDRRRISEFFASLPPPSARPQYERLVFYIDRGLAGVIRGQLLICCVNGFLTWLGLTILGIKYAGALALVAGVFSLIPVFGTIASSIPIVLVALGTGGVTSGVYALAWISLIHLLEANLFNPLIMGTNAEMHPVVIVFALLAGEHAFGVWGALLAVPTASILQSCFKYYRHEVEGIPHEAPPSHGAWAQKLVAKFRRKKAATPTPREGGGA